MQNNRKPPDGHPTLLARLRRSFRRFQACQIPFSQLSSRGQGFVEFALILPILLLLMLGILEFGYIFAAYSGLFNADREGARFGVVNPTDVSGIVDKAERKVLLADPDTVDIVVRYDSGPDTPQFTDPARVQIGDRVLVYVTCDLPTITPVIQPIVASLPVRTQAARTIASLGEGAWNPSGSDDDDGGDGDDEGDEGSAISLSVDASPQAVVSGSAVQFTYVVTNTGGLNLTDVTVVDDFGNTLLIGDLAAGATAIRTIVETINTTTTDEVTVTGVDTQGTTVSDVDSVTVTVVGIAMDLAVTASARTVLPGELVEFTYVVTNTGDADLTSVVVVDGFGTTTAPADVGVGQSVFWRVSYRIYETSLNDVTATGVGPLGGTAGDSESMMVVVADELAPIVISEPLQEGSTLVSGTAHAGRTVFIRDLMDGEFPAPASNSAVVLVDGSFEFTQLPPLVAGHVILVEAYGQWDSAVVRGDFDPIVINSLCHGVAIVDGTAQPGEMVSLRIAGTLYQDSMTVDASGVFTFSLPLEQPLQAGQTVEVSGYGESTSAVVEACTTDAYVVISPQCGPSKSTTFTVNGYNWEYQNQNDYVSINWDGNRVGIVEADALPVEWTAQVAVDMTVGVHQVSASNRKTPAVFASFLSPCPAPDLVVTDMSLLTPGPISTYQPLAFEVVVENVGPRPANSLFWVDLYASPPTTQATGITWAAVSGLGVADSVTVTVPFQRGFELTRTFPIWTFADSRNQIVELDEGNNDYGPIVVEVTQEGTPPLPPPTGTGRIVGETWVSMTGIPVPHGRTNVRCLDETGATIAATTSDDGAKYELVDLPAGTYTLIAETWIDSVRYSRVLDGIAVEDDGTAVNLIILYRD